MSTIITRASKGSALTWTEADANFNNLNTTKVESTSPTTSGTFTHSGNIVLPQNSTRITSDFTNSTISNRCFFQTSTTNGATSVGIIPNGTSTNSSFTTFGLSDPTNSHYAGISVTASEVRLSSSRTGTGTFMPLTIYTNGIEQMRVDTSGTVGIGAISLGEKLAIAGGIRFRDLETAATTYSGIGSIVSDNVSISTSGIERIRVTATGSVFFLTPVASGYGTGAGGTVTQGTSRLTAVTIDKPTGRITMFSDAGSSTVNSFVVNNSTVSANDVIIVNQASGTNIYTLRVSNVTTGAFTISFNTTTTSVDAPVINFAVIKGAIS